MPVSKKKTLLFEIRAGLLTKHSQYTMYLFRVDNESVVVIHGGDQGYQYQNRREQTKPGIADL